MLTITLCLLGTLAVLSLFFFLRKTPPGPFVTWLLITLLLAAIFCSALTSAPGTPILELASFVGVFIAGLGGSAPATYFLNKLGTSPTGESSQEPGTHHTTLKGRIGLLALQATLEKAENIATEVTGGGRLIGICERLALALCLITQQATLIAAIIAIKGLGRYPDIKAGHLTAEKFIIGTFVSLLWSAGCALLIINLR